MTEALLFDLRQAEAERDRLEKELEACVDKIDQTNRQLRAIEDDARHAPLKALLIEAQATKDIAKTMEAVCHILAFVTNRQLVYRPETIGSGRVYHKIMRQWEDRSVHDSTMCHADPDGSVYHGGSWARGQPQCNAFNVDYVTLRQNAFRLTW